MKNQYEIDKWTRADEFGRLLPGAAVRRNFLKFLFVALIFFGLLFFLYEIKILFFTDADNSIYGKTTSEPSLVSKVYPVIFLMFWNLIVLALISLFRAKLKRSD